MESDECLHKVLTLQPQNALAHFHLVNFLLRRGELSSSVNCHQKAVAINPDYAEAHHNLSCSLNRIGSFDQALLHYMRALEIREDYPEARCSLGFMLMNMGQLEEEAFSGIAAVAAMAAIPGPLDGHNNVIGFGGGYYKGESAIAAGFTANITPSMRMAGGVGYSNDNVTSS